MDYDFKKNTLDGTYRAEFSMGHEVLGRWLTEEVGRDLEKLDLVVRQLESLKDTGQEWLLSGEELTLVLQDNEALVQENCLFSQHDEELDEDMHLWDEESISVCGFEDLHQALLAWRAFVCRY